ncbi:HlyD family secretion protein [Clostridium omnivorum]|uniref:Hemolysin D n=1 Tax=Clostridium omnivorum TaxID=1604902 RepID=A0ABQ5N342_9CLOT|nr:biotin/lipoyl-binding protein [Clostridium sp. E14]GLC29624.1 hemolysin D [Clostridium sp. E14]
MYKRIASMLLIIGLSLTTVGCSTTNKDDENRYTATVEAESFYIPAEVSGKVLELSIQEGSELKAGEKIAQLDSKVYELQKKQAEANLTLANLKKEDIPDKAKDNLKDQAQAAVDQAQAAVDLNQLQIDKTAISSSVDGTVMEVYAHKGELVAAGSNLAKVLNSKEKYVKVYIEESKRNSIKLGGSLPIYSDGKNIGSGTIVYISPQSEFTPKNTETKSDKEKTVFEVKLTLPSDIQAAIGMMVDVEIK